MAPSAEHGDSVTRLEKEEVADVVRDVLVAGAVWEAPNAFMPERFVDGHEPQERGAQAARAQLASFGSGPRSCVGQQLALTLASLTLAHMMAASTFRNYTIGPGYCLLTWSIYEGQDRLDVPMLEVVSHVLLVMSILSVLVLIWFRKRPTKDLLLQDSWGTVRVSDCAIRLYNFVGMADLLMAILTLLLMTAPIPHEDDFAHWVYTSRGLLDNLPWLCCLHNRLPTRVGLLRTTLLLATLIGVRACAVFGEPALNDYLFSFAPTELAMYANVSFAVLYAILLLLTLSGRCRPLRPQCRLWLLFLAVCYMCSTLGYFLFRIFAIDPTTAMWIGELGLFLYVLLFAPALYASFLLERAHWTRSTNSWAGMPSLEPTNAPLLAGGLVSTTPPSPGAAGAALTVAVAAGQARKALRPSDVQSAQMLRAALEGVRVIPFTELKLHELIGTGGFADLRTLPRERKALEGFCKEIALMQRLQHPNVLSLVGVSITSSGQLSVITDYLMRGSVFQLLHPTPTPAGQLAIGVPLPRVLAMCMMGDCARGMGYLHSLSPSIIHRDLKSQNLLVAPDFSVQVADFGLSRECLHQAAMTRVGSVQWAAPEVLLGQSYSHKCDLWSFGVVCWEVLTARVPFDGMSPATVATQVAMEGMRLPVPPGVSIRLLRLIARCWSEQPEHRPEFGTLEVELQGVVNELLDEEGRAVAKASTQV
ncbi:serine threonine protein kinase 1 ctr1 [Chrysochromulina tobinii]|uniref:Serine threonine protein kinase 1 ctr1 n=1 Tax=Chrysochromulina tobinii TaxID=1460289 RepID=A0A0M0K9B5_9EUKA|nr:serine threonine protein kinase 1 ctr1 [Chrysochromulina tobinii]|eukprot:KOO34968.1 serine threonine protein kinase 1 ctr1 [Chrysochromulina sp. CCMP291]